MTVSRHGEFRERLELLGATIKRIELVGDASTRKEGLAGDQNVAELGVAASSDVHEVVLEIMRRREVGKRRRKLDRQRARLEALRVSHYGSEGKKGSQDLHGRTTNDIFDLRSCDRLPPTR